MKKPYIDDIDFEVNKPTKEHKDSSIEIPDKIIWLFAGILVIKVIVLFVWLF